MSLEYSDSSHVTPTHKHNSRHTPGAAHWPSIATGLSTDCGISSLAGATATLQVRTDFLSI